MNIDLRNGDCLDVLKTLPDCSVDSVVTDPPYGLSKQPDMVEVLSKWIAGDDYTHRGGGFMGKEWDSFVPGPCVWRECLRVLKPGGYLLAFFGSRTYDLGTLAIRLAGFEIRDTVAWVYSSGFPKSMDVSKMIDKMAGAKREVLGVAGRSGSRRSCMENKFAGGEYMETAPATDDARKWQGWGTALKPPMEPICVARKPFIGTVVANVLKHGTGAINIDGCRIVSETGGEAEVRWPANIIHDGSDEVETLFPVSAKGDDLGSAARFFYCAKASKKDRNEGLADSGIDSGSDKTGNFHPTVKPTDLMRYLVRLVTPPGGIVLDPYMGSGSTGRAAQLEGFDFVGIEMSAEYFEIAKSRIDNANKPVAKRQKKPEAEVATSPSDDDLFIFRR